MINHIINKTFIIFEHIIKIYIVPSHLRIGKKVICIDPGDIKDKYWNTDDYGNKLQKGKVYTIVGHSGDSIFVEGYQGYSVDPRRFVKA